jgi:RNA polymerase sigma-70 factor (ECF subfamily)
MTQIDESTQTTLLVEKASAGNRFAYEQLVNLFQEGIFRMVYYRTNSTMDAEDITQDIFIQAFKHLSRLKGAEKFKSWLFSIGVNKVRDFHRKKRFQNLFGSFSDTENDEQTYPDAADNPGAMDNLIKRDFWKQVRLLLDKLPPMEREVFTLRFMDHLTIKEISLVLKKGESTIKTHLYRALQKFRKEPSMLELLKENSS